jgi:hypothetical protein
MLVGKERDEKVIKIKDSYKDRSEVVIRKGSEIVRLGNEVIILENAFRIVQGQPYKRLCKINKEPMKDYRKSLIY